MRSMTKVIMWALEKVFVLESTAWNYGYGHKYGAFYSGMPPLAHSEFQIGWIPHLACACPAHRYLFQIPMFSQSSWLHRCPTHSFAYTPLVGAPCMYCNTIEVTPWTLPILGSKHNTCQCCRVTLRTRYIRTPTSAWFNEPYLLVCVDAGSRI